MAIGDSYELNYQSALGIAEESTWSTLATATAFIEFLTETFQEEIDPKRLDTINSQRAPHKRVLGNATLSGGLEAYLDPASDGIIMMLKQALGGTVTSSVLSSTGTAYSHQLDVGDMELNSGTSTATDTKGLSFQIRRGSNYAWYYTGCRISSFTLKGEVGEPVMFTAEVVGRYSTQTTGLSTTVTISDTLPVIFTGIGIRNGDSIGAITPIPTGTTETFDSFELAVNTNLQSDIRSLGSRSIAHLPPGTLDVTLSLTQRFDTTTAYNRWIGETALAVAINLDTGQTIGAEAAGSTYSMDIQLPRVYHDSGATPMIGGRDGVLTQELQLTSLYDPGAGYQIRVIANNATANYE